jgi:hypothetical protein
METGWPQNVMFGTSPRGKRHWLSAKVGERDPQELGRRLGFLDGPSGLRALSIVKA